MQLVVLREIDRRADDPGTAGEYRHEAGLNYNCLIAHSSSQVLTDRNEGRYEGAEGSTHCDGEL